MADIIDNYTQEQHDIFEAVINSERMKRNLEILIKRAEYDGGFIDWYFEEAQFSLPEFNSEEDAKKIENKQIKIWTAIHVIYPEHENDPIETIPIYQSTNWDTFKIIFETLRETTPGEEFRWYEGILNKPIELYLPHIPPDWYRDLNIEPQGNLITDGEIDR